MRRLVLGLVTIGLLLGLELTVGFSQWPVRAQQSLDFTFEPSGGIEQVTGTLVAVSST